MSCDRRCFEKNDNWHQHDDCGTCPGQDSGPRKDGKTWCSKCNTWHDANKWPHVPNAPADQTATAGMVRRDVGQEV
jgi:hypothetical protein